MFDRSDAQSHERADDHASRHHPDRVETAEFTMNNHHDADSTVEQTTDDGLRGNDDRVFDQERIDSHRAEWDDVQARFVEDPRRSVAQADQLIASTIDDIARYFTEERSRLERDWKSAGDASTEDMRITLQRYRALLNRLLSK